VTLCSWIRQTPLRAAQSLSLQANTTSCSAPTQPPPHSSFSPP
jgi:hypothetical protein